MKWTSGLAVVLLAACLAGCSTTRLSWNLWPIVQIDRDPEQAYSEARALGPLVRVRRDGDQREWAVHPIVHSKGEAGRRDVRVLSPLARYRRDEDSSWLHLLPVLLRRTLNTEIGRRASLLVFPVFYRRTAPDSPSSLALFPFYGKLHGVLGRDRIRFYAFPAYYGTTLGSRRSHNALWPFFGWSRGADARSLRVFPFYSRNRKAGRHDRRFFLWPFFHFHRTHLHTDRPTRMFLFFPFFGREVARGRRHRTILWPFFGFNRDEVIGTKVVSAPWPILQWGHTPRWKRFRFWPFYGSYESEELRSRFYAWPLVWRRSERTDEYSRESFRFIPFYSGQKRVAAETGVVDTRRHVWPFFYSAADSEGNRSRRALSLNLWRRFETLEELYSPLWTVYSRDGTADSGEAEYFFGAVRRRWTHERRSLSFPWVYRGERTADGRSDRSVLLGLFRWTNDGRRTTLRIASFPVARW